MIAWFFATSLGRTIAAAVAVLVVLLLALSAFARRIRGAERAAIEFRRNRAAVESHERMNDADVGYGDAADDAAWLRRFGERNGGHRSGAPDGR
jgi:hypothetical protein